MTNYKKTGKYSPTPTGDIYVGSQNTTGYSGRSMRVDDNFTKLASSTGGPTYYQGTGIVIYDDTSYDPSRRTIRVDFGSVAGKVSEGNHTHSYSSITNHLVAGACIDITESNEITIKPTELTAALNVATTSIKGLLSSSDKTKLDTIAENANCYSLPIATTTTLGGIIVNPDPSGNLTITSSGILSAVDTTYSDAIASVGQLGGSHGLMTAVDKEKVSSISWGATHVEVKNTDHNDGTIWLDNYSRRVYIHPAYSVIAPSVESYKVVKAIEVDDTGHVTNVIKGNSDAINLNFALTAGNVISGASFTYPTLSLYREDLGNLILNVIDTSSSSTLDIASTDTLKLALKKLQNKTERKLDYKGTIGVGGTYTTEPAFKTNGDTYKIVSSMYIGGNQVFEGDLLIFDEPNNCWVVIPSGIRNTWRPIYVGGEQVLNDTVSSGALKIVGYGDVEVKWLEASNTVSISSYVYDYLAGDGIVITGTTDKYIDVKVSSAEGNAITLTEDGLFCTYGVEYGTTVSWSDITGTNPLVNTSLATAFNTKQKVLQAGNYINITQGNQYDTISASIPNATAVIPGLLTANDYVKLQGISTSAKNVNSSSINGNIKIDGSELTVYQLPVASSSTLGGVTVDGITITVNSSGKLTVPSVVGYTGGYGITVDTTVSPNTINAKASSYTGNALQIRNDGLYVPTAVYTAGDGISITGNAISTKVDGTTIVVNAQGKLSATGGGGGSGYILPTATANTKGGVKVGNGLHMTTSSSTDLDTINVVVDNSLSSTSDNPLKNKVIYSLLLDKQNTLIPGSNIAISGNTISATDTTYSDATQQVHGLMSITDKTKLDGIAVGATSVTVDSELDSTSTNPVQNKKVKAAIDSTNATVSSLVSSLGSYDSTTKTLTIK